MLSQKRSEKQTSAEHTLKSRYLDKEKQKTVPLINRTTKAIRLTDLCPQEKQKVGELIKTLELRKLENEQLNEEIDSLRRNFEEMEFQLTQATRQLAQKEQQCQELNLKLAELETREKEQTVKSLKLALDLAKYKDIASSIKSVKKSTNSTQTDASSLPSPCSQSTQTKKPKTKTKSIQISSQAEQHLQRSIFYRPHSKSFQKIMKPPLEHQNSYFRSQNDFNSTHRHASRMENQEEEVRRTSAKRNTEEEPEICEDSLSKKWQKLQERNKIHNSSGSRPTNKFYDEFSQPRQFIEVEDTQKNASKQNSHLNSIDQLELNKMLKSKNFSASKLMSYRGVLSEAQTFRKPAPSVQIEVNYLKKPIFESEPTTYNPKLTIHNPSRPRPTPLSNPSSAERINFYESDLLEIGSSMQS